MPQIWPSADTFDHGSPPYGETVIGYLGVLPSIAAYGSARLSSGYPFGGASLVEGAVAGETAGVMRRQVFSEDCRVTAVTRLHAVTGTATSADFAQAGVVARVQGGTLAGDGTSQVRYGDVDGYGFLVSQLTPTTLRFQLVRWNAGVETVLATFDGSSSDLGHFLSDVDLVLEVKANGSDVDLAAFVSQVGFAAPDGSLVYQAGGSGGRKLTGTLAPLGPAPSTGTVLPTPPLSAQKVIGAAKVGGLVQVLSHTDAAAGKITGPGRCGFLAGTEQVGGGGTPETVSITSVFEVAELSGSAWIVAWRDEWLRAVLSLCEPLTDLHGTPGRNLGSDYSSDQASVETTDVLTRATGEEAAEMPNQLDLGKAVEFEGDKLQYISISTPDNVFPLPAAANQTEITIAQWLRLDSNRDGNQFYDGYKPSVSADEQGFRWGWRDAGGGDAVIEVTLGGKDAPQVFQTPAFGAANFLNGPNLWAMTYKANANTGTGEGRIRIYVGLLGSTTLIGEMIVPADTRPTWLYGYRHLIGSNVDGPTSPERDMDGVVDGFRIFYEELTQLQVDQLSDPLLLPAVYSGWSLVHAVDFEVLNDNSPLAREYKPSVPAGLPVQDWWLETGPSGLPLLAEPGLVPQPATTLVAWSQRSADDPVDQRQSIRINHASDLSIAGLIVRGTPTADPEIYTGYRLDLATGTPTAAANLYRVVGGAAVMIARMDSASLDVALAVITGAYATLQLNVADQVDAPPGSAVAISAEINDTAVVWELLDDPGVILESSTVVVDASTGRVTSGPAVGFHTLADSDPTLLDDWQLGDNVTAPVVYPSLAIPGEADGAFGDLSDVLVVEYTVEPMHIAPRRQVDFESSHQQRTALGTYEPRAFRVATKLSPAQRVALDAFWTAHKGPVIGFGWDPGTFLSFEQPGVFHFKAKSLSIRPGDGLNYHVSFELEERRADPTPV